MDTILETPLTADLINREILWNADYGDRSDGALTLSETWHLHQQVQNMLATTNGDAGIHEISTRQLALFLACSVKVNAMKKALDEIKDLLKQHPEFSEGNSKVHYCANLARSASSLK